MTVSLLDRSWDEALDTIASYGVRHVEANAGGHIPKDHFDPQALAADPGALRRFRESLEQRELAVCAFGCYGNPVHPMLERRTQAHEDFVATCRLAGELGVDRVSVISGCPAGGPHDRAPNWIINSIYPDFANAYRWQWEECLIPYWQRAAEVADRHGVRICVEPHGGDMVYNTETFLRLRQAVGPTIGANFDPSHLFWMGVDVLEMIAELGDAIIHICQGRLLRAVGDPTARPRPGGRLRRLGARSWLYRAVGHGHPEAFWRDYVTALRRAGYDDVVVIELEEPFMSTGDALDASVSTLRAALPAAPFPPATGSTPTGGSRPRSNDVPCPQSFSGKE